jgi:hypothetical protein
MAVGARRSRSAWGDGCWARIAGGLDRSQEDVAAQHDLSPLADRFRVAAATGGAGDDDAIEQAMH